MTKQVGFRSPTTQKVKGNPRTFEEVYKLNMNADVLDAQDVMVKAHRKAAASALMLGEAAATTQIT